MSAVRDAVSFIGQIAPALFELGRDLYQRHRGDTIQALVELRRIRDHGGKWMQTEAELRAELEAAEAVTKREKPPK